VDPLTAVRLLPLCVRLEAVVERAEDVSQAGNVTQTAEDGVTEALEPVAYTHDDDDNKRP
jgi:hypothetical protein